MYLELADNYLSESQNFDFDMIPVLDPITGEIYMINIEAFLMLSYEEQIEAVNQAPFLMQKIIEQGGAMDAGLFSKIREGVSNFVQKAANVINPNVTPSGTPKMDKPFTMDPTFNPDKTSVSAMPGIDPKFALNIGVEPSPKPWFARPEVLLPVIGGVGLIAFFAFRRK
jgi:hypothetical protein